MTVRRIDQGMAAAAARLLPARVSPEMRTRYRQLRVMLHTAGLAATYAFLASKASDGGDLGVAYQRAAEGIRERLVSAELMVGDARRMSARDVLASLGAMSAVQYARASAEAAALAGWLSRLADAQVAGESPTDAGQAADRREPAGSHAGRGEGPEDGQ